jgi:pimeloyl-ACP methyl ester carboxylesterase
MSEKPENYDYQLSSQADIVIAFLDALHITRFSLIGHSMGGSIAILIALKQPQRVTQLIVIEPNLRAGDAHLSREIIQYQEPHFIECYQEFLSSAIALVKTWFVNLQQTDLEEYIDELLKTTSLSMYRSALSLVNSTSDDTLLNQFQQLALSKHFLIGQESMKDLSIPENFARSDVNTVIVPGVGHMMMVDDPSLFNRTLDSVLQ